MTGIEYEDLQRLLANPGEATGHRGDGSVGGIPVPTAADLEAKQDADPALDELSGATVEAWGRSWLAMAEAAAARAELGLGAAATMSPVEVVTDEDAQAALSGASVWGPLAGPSYGLPTPGQYGTTGAAIQDDRMVFSGLPVVNQRTWTRLGVDVYTAGAAAWVGLYRIEGWRDNSPGTLHLVHDFGTYDMSEEGTVENVVPSFTLPPGFYAVGARLEPSGTGSLRRVEGPGRMWEIFHPSAPSIRNYAPALTVTPGAKPETVTHFTTIVAGGGPFAWLR